MMQQMPQIQIQSNSIRGDYKDVIVDTTITEIHDMISSVFGPYATDAYIVKDNVSTNKTYYTRDGKEVLNSLAFDNPVANYVKSIMYQAVDRQGSRVGDGTTTLAVFYSNLYRCIRQMDEFRECSLTEIRSCWKNVVTKINKLLEGVSTKDITKDMFASMIYTCTQDVELTKYFTDNVVDKLVSGMYVSVNRSASDTDLEVVVNDKPLIKAELLSTLYHMDEQEFDAITLFVNGPLEIANEDTLRILCETRYGACRNIVIICANTAPITRDVMKSYLTNVGGYVKASGKPIKEVINNLIIMKIPDFIQYPKDMIEDLATYVYGTEHITGIISPLTFESLLWQSYRSLLAEDGCAMPGSCPSLETFEFDPKHIDHMKSALKRIYPVAYDETKGLQLSIPIGPAAQLRYDELRKLIESENVEVKKNEHIRRLKSLYGQFIEVNIGAKLMKDGQRKYELILDAVLSAVNARTYGALRMNSICAAYCAAKEVRSKLETSDTLCKNKGVETLCAGAIITSLFDTIYDIVVNACPTLQKNALHDIMENTEGVCMDELSNSKFKFNLNREYAIDIFNPDYTDAPIEVGGFTIQDTIVEPLPVITSILDNSVMMVELACAKMFNVASFIGNYI